LRQSAINPDGTGRDATSRTQAPAVLIREGDQDIGHPAGHIQEYSASTRPVRRRSSLARTARSTSLAQAWAPISSIDAGRGTMMISVGSRATAVVD
jgi:hypothetical protein